MTTTKSGFKIYNQLWLAVILMLAVPYTHGVTGVLAGFLLVFYMLNAPVPEFEVDMTLTAPPTNTVMPIVTTNTNPNVVEFNITGIDGLNEDQKDIQKVLSQKARKFCRETGTELYAGYKAKEIVEDGIEVCEFEDLMLDETNITFLHDTSNPYLKYVYKVYVNFQESEDPKDNIHIGFVPEDVAPELHDILQKNTELNLSMTFTGGKYKTYEYDFTKDKDVLLTDEKTLQAVITIYK